MERLVVLAAESMVPATLFWFRRQNRQQGRETMELSSSPEPPVHHPHFSALGTILGTLQYGGSTAMIGGGIVIGVASYEGGATPTAGIIVAVTGFITAFGSTLVQAIREFLKDRRLRQEQQAAEREKEREHEEKLKAAERDERERNAGWDGKLRAMQRELEDGKERREQLLTYVDALYAYLDDAINHIPDAMMYTVKHQRPQRPAFLPQLPSHETLVAIETDSALRRANLAAGEPNAKASDSPTILSSEVADAIPPLPIDPPQSPGSGL